MLVEQLYRAFAILFRQPLPQMTPRSVERCYAT